MPNQIPDDTFYSNLRQELIHKLKQDPVLKVLNQADDSVLRTSLTMLNPTHQISKIKLIKEFVGYDLKNKSLLEVGCGLGDFVLQCRRNQIYAFGVEPHNNSYGDLKDIGDKLTSHFMLDKSFIKYEDAENLSFHTNSFDVVYSHYVLEHSCNPIKILTESWRVLKPGGDLLFVFPNYGSFWEGHYGCLWPPYASRSLGKLWVRCFGKNPSFIDTLQLINIFHVRRWIKQIGRDAKVCNLGLEKFVQEVGDLSFDTAGSLHKAKSILAVLKKTGLLKLVVITCAKLGMFTPFYLHLRKSDNPS